MTPIRIDIPNQPTIKDLQAPLRQYSVSDGLQTISRLSRGIQSSDDRDPIAGVKLLPDATLTQWDLAFITKQLIVCSNDGRSAHLSKNTDAIRKILAVTGNMRDPTVNIVGALNQERIDSYFVRTFYQQFRFQGEVESALFRTFLLYHEVWHDIPDPFDLDSASEEVYGMPFKRFLQLGLCVYLVARNHAAFNLSDFGNTSDPALTSILTPINLGKFWPSVAVDYQGFRKLCLENRIDDPAYARFEFNPLEARPVIHVRYPKNIFILPSFPCLLLRFTEGIYHDFFNHYLGKGNHRVFTSFFGRIFEKYIGQQLKSYFGNTNVIEERVYNVGKDEWRGPDWIVEEGENALVIECKASRPTLPVKTTADYADLEAEVDNKLLKVIELFPEKIQHIREKPDVWPELVGVKNFYSVVVTLEPWWPAGIFSKILTQKLVENKLDVFPFHLISVRDLENMLCLIEGGQSLSAFLEARIEKSKQSDAIGPEISAKFQELNLSNGNKLLESARDKLFTEAKDDD